MKDKLTFKCKECGHVAEDYNLVPIEVNITKNKVTSIATCPICDAKHTMYKINNNWFNRMIARIISVFTFRARISKSMHLITELFENVYSIQVNHEEEIQKLKEEVEALKSKSSKKPKVNKESKSKNNKKK